VIVDVSFDRAEHVDGGFLFGHHSQTNRLFVCLFVAEIKPIDKSLQNYTQRLSEGIGVAAHSTLEGHVIFARKICMKN